MHHVFLFYCRSACTPKDYFFSEKHLFSMSKPNVEIRQFIDIETFDSDSDSEKRLTLTVTLTVTV
jgi:hypothetical protein